jgi:hypothetical protein
MELATVLFSFVDIDEWDKKGIACDRNPKNLKIFHKVFLKRMKSRKGIPW